MTDPFTVDPTNPFGGHVPAPDTRARCSGCGDTSLKVFSPGEAPPVGAKYICAHCCEDETVMRALAHCEAARILRVAAQELEDASEMPGAEWTTCSGTHDDEVQRVRDRILWAAARFGEVVRVDREAEAAAMFPWPSELAAERRDNV